MSFVGCTDMSLVIGHEFDDGLHLRRGKRHGARPPLPVAMSAEKRASANWAYISTETPKSHEKGVYDRSAVNATALAAVALLVHRPIPACHKPPCARGCGRAFINLLINVLRVTRVYMS